MIGVNAQIITGSCDSRQRRVGFAIPVNIVAKRVVPVSRQAPINILTWGIEGTSMNLLLAEANDLSATGRLCGYVVPAAQPLKRVCGQHGIGPPDGPTPTGGDVIVEADGQDVNIIRTCCPSSSPATRRRMERDHPAVDGARKSPELARRPAGLPAAPAPGVAIPPG